MNPRLYFLFLAAIFALVAAQETQEAVVNAEGEAEVSHAPIEQKVSALEQLQAQYANLNDALNLCKERADTCHKEMSEISMQLAGCEEARVAAKNEAKEALEADSTMRQNARSAQEQVSKLEAEIESLKAALKDRNDEIVELKLSVSELKESQAALRAQTEGMTTEQLCTRCAREGFAEAKQRAGVLIKQGVQKVKLAFAHATRVIETTVLPAVRERSQPIVTKARELYAGHAQAHVEQLKQQFDQHAGPYVLQAEQFYKQHVAEHVAEKSRLAIETAKTVLATASDTVAAHPLTTRVMGREVTSSEVSQALYSLWLVVASFLGMVVAWKVLKGVTCVLLWPCRKLGMCGGSSRAARQYKRQSR